jgi:hypothetical protein
VVESRDHLPHDESRDDPNPLVAHGISQRERPGAELAATTTDLRTILQNATDSAGVRQTNWR